jgi:hypothetical protein
MGCWRPTGNDEAKGALLTRDARWVAVHRGGSLDAARRRLLASWAADCAEHVLPVFAREHPHDDRPRLAIEAARAWSRDEISAGTAHAAAVEAHAAARNASDAAAVAAARAAGHAAATAHMADHALGAAAYAVRAAGLAAGESGGSAAALERSRQDERLPEEVRELVSSAEERRSALR